MFSWVDNVALRDAGLVLEGTTTSQLTIGGLDSEELYKVEVLSTSPLDADYLGTVEVQSEYSDDGDSELWNSYIDGFVHDDVMVWASVSPDGSGNIVIDFTYGGEAPFFINGFRIVKVSAPEPSLLALLVTGGLALAAWRPYRGN